jgi:replicative DNA helicase
MNANDIELSVLGCVLLDNTMLRDISAILEPKDFNNHHNQQVFKAMLEMARNELGIDVITLDKWTDGKYTTIITACNNVPTAANALHYAEIVKRASDHRQFRKALKDADSKLDSSGIENVLSMTMQSLNEIIEGNSNNDYHHVRHLAGKVATEMMQPEVESRGVKTHILTLDRAIGCLRNSDLIVIGARPSMGKTAFILSIIMNMAINGDASLIFSHEMARTQLTERFLCQIHGASMQDMTLKLNMEENSRRIVQAAQVLHELPILINDKAPKFHKIESIMRTAKKEHGIKAVFIDYLQLMMVDRSMGENRNQQLGYITRNLKRIAKELDIPIVLLAQLNRGLEQRTNKRPMLSDLRDSGEIEQDADVVIFLYRDEMYHRNTNDKGIVEVDVAKARNMGLAWMKLAFLADCIKLADLAKDYDEEG